MRALRFLCPALMLLTLVVWSAGASDSTWNYALRYSTFASSLEQAQSSSFMSGLFPVETGYAEGHPESIELSYDLESLIRRDAPTDSSRPVLQPGLGQYFADDTVGRSLRAGTGLEDPRHLYLKLRVRF